jgi:hypothetical protein
MLAKIAASGVGSRVFVWVREFILGHMQRVGWQYSEEVEVTSGVLQRSVLSALLFLTYMNDIWRNIKSSVRFFTGDCTTN